MPIKLTYLTPLLAAAAPIASAASAPLQQSCNETVSGSECESPGNVEINDTPPPMNFDPYGDDGFLIGGYGAYGFHGGGVHGGGGHR